MGKLASTDSKLSHIKSTTLDLLSISCWRWDLENNELYVDDVWSRLLSPLNGTPIDINWWLQQTHPNDTAALKSLLDSISSRKIDDFKGEFRFKDSNGKWKPMQVFARIDSKLTSNSSFQVVGVLAPSNDYTSESSVREYDTFYEHTFEESFEHTAIGMAILDLEGRWRKVNPQLEEILGYSENELKEITFGDLTHPDDLKYNNQVFKRLVQGKQSHFYTEKRYLHKNGSYIHAFLSTTLVKDNQDWPHHFLARIVDITHLVRATRELEVLLKISNGQVERLQNFAYIVSHNLKSHVANIQGLSLIIEGANLNEKDQKHIGYLKSTANKLSKTIDQLQEIVHFKNNVSENLTAIVLSKVVQLAVQNTEAEGVKAQATITTNVHKHLKVLGLHAYLESILFNLVLNAIKYRSTDRPCRVSIDAEKVDDKVSISISDNGRGIDLEKNGEILYDLYETFHENADSQGIGLFITKNQVDAMGGKIDVESQVGIGTTFTVTLPAAL